MRKGMMWLLALVTMTAACIEHNHNSKGQCNGKKCPDDKVCSHGKCVDPCRNLECPTGMECRSGFCSIVGHKVEEKETVQYDCEGFPKTRQATITAWDHYRMGTVCKAIVNDYNAAIDTIREDDPDVPLSDVGAVALQCTEKWLSGKGITSVHARAYGEKMLNCLGWADDDVKDEDTCANYPKAKEKCIALWFDAMGYAGCETITNAHAEMVAAVTEDDPEISANDAMDIVRKCTDPWLQPRTITDMQASLYTEELMTCIAQP